MSNINVQTILMYRGDENHRPVEKALPLTGVEKLFRGTSFPTKGPTFLYGHRNPAVPYFREEAERLGLEAGVIDVTVDIGQWFRNKIELSDKPDRGLQHSKFLNVQRASIDITDIMYRQWLRELGPSLAFEDDWPRSATRYPYMMDSIIALPEFSHLTVITYRVKTAEVGDIQVATVFDLDKIDEVDGGSKFMDTNFVL